MNLRRLASTALSLSVKVLDYLQNGHEASPDALYTINNKLQDDFVRMIQLGNTWLLTLLPFVLGKINRVNFGLLTEDYLATVEPKDGPRTRR
jgi:hypothetical protein